jgi:hypothetical protein
VAASLGGIAALGITLPADAQLPGVGANLHVTRQTDGAIRESQARCEASTERASRICVRTGCMWGLRFGGMPDIRFWLVATLLPAK